MSTTPTQMKLISSIQTKCHSGQMSQSRLVFLLLAFLILVAYGKEEGGQPLSLQLRRRRGQEEGQRSNDGIGGDKVVLLNDLSLEQAYLHHAAEGRLDALGGGGVSLAQQAARLAAGAYARWVAMSYHPLCKPT